MKSCTIKNALILFLCIAVTAGGYKYYKTEQKLDSINSVLQSNPKLMNCLVHPRKILFIKRGGEYFPDYEHPRTLNDKVAYILDNYFLRSPITTVIGTKYFAKKYVADIVGEEHVVKLLGAWDNPEDIEWNKLPSRFVLKSVRGNFGREVILVTDKSKLDIDETVKKLYSFFDTPYMKACKKRVIAEELLEPEGKTFIDYKFFCSYGKPLLAYCLEKKKDTIADVDSKTLSFYSIPEWKHLPVKAGTHGSNFIPRPKTYKKMLDLCAKLSKDFPLIRIDLYEIGDRVLVGELTEDASGAKNILSPVEWDFKFGENIPVPSEEEINLMIEKDKEICKKYLAL